MLRRLLSLAALTCSLMGASVVSAAETAPETVLVRLGGGYAHRAGYSGDYAAPGRGFTGGSADHLWFEARGHLATGVGLWLEGGRTTTGLRDTRDAAALGPWSLFTLGAGLGARAALGPVLTEWGIGYGLSLEPLPSLGGEPAAIARRHAMILSLKGRLPLPAQFELDVGTRVPLTVHLSGPSGVPLDGHAQSLELGLTRHLGTLATLGYGLRLAGRQQRVSIAGARGQGAFSLETALTLALEVRWTAPPDEPEEEEW